MKVEYKKDGIEIGGVFLSLEDITSKCIDAKLKEQEIVLLEMSWEGRGGSVSEQRALPLEKALSVKEILLGREVYFGEIWGKHSEVYGTMCEKTFNIERDSEKVKNFLKEFPSGIDYDHSFIETFIESEQETQELLDKLQSLL